MAAVALIIYLLKDNATWQLIKNNNTDITGNTGFNRSLIQRSDAASQYPRLTGQQPAGYSAAGKILLSEKINPQQ